MRQSDWTVDNWSYENDSKQRQCLIFSDGADEWRSPMIKSAGLIVDTLSNYYGVLGTSKDV